MLKYKVFIVALSFVLLTGCASIVSDSEYPVRLNSTPKDASVVVENSAGETFHKGRTPTRVTLSASEGFFQPASYTAKFSKNGSTETRPINAGMDPWYIGNVVFGGVIGWVIVDPATGAMWELDEKVHADLGPNDLSKLNK